MVRLRFKISPRWDIAFFERLSVDGHAPGMNFKAFSRQPYNSL
jgi:hypothetical protein